MNWQKGLKIKFKEKEPLRNHTTFRIGGTAKYFFEPKNSLELKSLLKLLIRYKIPFLVLGAGSNILVGDKGFGGAVIHLRSPYFKKINYSGRFLEAKSGVLLREITLFSKKQGLSGAEFLAGIPGTLGGALAMNAGSQGKSIGDLIEDITVMDHNGNIKIIPKNKIKFSYRNSDLSKYIILSARLKLLKANKQEVKKRIARYLDYRRLTQDLRHSSAGCIFKNPPGYSAGKIIDLCGLKGRHIGGASISQRHANFILNLKNAKSRDVLRLITLIKEQVKKKFKIDLEPEIKIWQ